MGLSLILLCLSLLFHSGVFGDPDEVKSVMEGEFVTLHTDIVKQKDDLIVWTYGPDNKLLARLNGKASSTMLSKDEMFRDRLKLDDQTGSLTITHITSEHSGLYTLKISSNNKVSYKRFSVTVYDEMKSLSVREGHSVILYTHVLKKRDALIEWTHGPENTHVATIDVQANNITYSDDERFRARVKMDDQTGALMIHDTITNHSGLHTLKISNNQTHSYKSFNVTVKDDVKSVSVRDGHSVILYTHVLKQGHDLMVWTYGPENTHVAAIDVEANSIMLSEDEMFIDRLKMDDQTGSLMIHDITTHHSGLYTLKIISNNKLSYMKFSVTVYDEMKPVSIREGHSFILYTHVLKDRDDLIEWTHGPENTHVATIDVEANSIMFTDDERFRDRVKLEDQTGDLMIHDTITHHSGLHTLKITNNHRVSYKGFSVTIVTVSDFRVQWLCVIPAVLLICACICICIWVFVRKQRANSTKKQLLTDDGSSKNSSITNVVDCEK